MDASFLALGITLFAAALVPLTYGRYARAAGLSYLATVSWGTGMGWALGLVFLGATVLALVVIVAGLGMRGGRMLLGSDGRRARRA